MHPNIDPTWIRQLLLEDAPFGDPSLGVFEDNHQSSAYFLAKENGIFCGTDMIEKVFSFLGTSILVSLFIKDGQTINRGDKIAQIDGDTKLLLRGERIILNLISYLSGIATETSKYVAIAQPFGVKILDTRKTLPLYRELSKYAVRVGGGFNHRFCLSDMIMLKDNHIAGCGGIDSTFEKLHLVNKNPFLKIEVEVKNLKEALNALKYNPDVIMLDNFTPDEVEKALYFLKDKVEIELSGGINLANLDAYAMLQPNYISVGSLTHHVNSLDISMKFVSQ
jgi:nicotinate-nucleotide pyrophosphorylase (carboxylating)